MLVKVVTIQEATHLERQVTQQYQMILSKQANVDVGGLFGFGARRARTLQEILKSGPKTMEELEY